jgi:hypothetical protein
MLNPDAHAAQVHGKIVFQVKAAFCGRGVYFFKVSCIQAFQDAIIQMQPVEAHADGLVKEFEGRQLPGPGQLKIGPGLANAVQI